MDTETPKTTERELSECESFSESEETSAPATGKTLSGAALRCEESTKNKAGNETARKEARKKPSGTRGTSLYEVRT